MTCNCSSCKNCDTNKNLSDLLKVVAEENRLGILCFLLSGDKCAGDIADRMKMKHNLVSFHLKKLSDARILNSKKDGSRVFYAIREDQREHIEKLVSLCK